jgi:hypothetical protein
MEDKLMPSVVLTIETDEVTSNQLREDMAKVTREEILVQKREGLGGMFADFITILQATSPIVVAVLPLVIERARLKKVRRVRLDNFEVENPSDEQVRTLWERFIAANPERKP